jgi:arylsulfatase A-like enzyme
VPVDARVQDPKAPVKEGNEIGQIPAYAYLPGKQQIRDYVAQYDGDIRCLDEHLGALVDWMRAQGALDHTVLIVTADHGESLGDHDYFFEHGRYPYDDCVRVPLIVVHSGWKPARIAAPVGLIDVAPTLVELLGLAPGWQFEGRSFLASLRAGAAVDAERPVFTESGYLKEFETSVRKGRFKLIHVGTRYMAGFLTGKPYELYDVVADPGETKNLVDEKPDTLEELRAELDAFMETQRLRVPPLQDGKAFTPNAEEQKIIDELGYGNDKERAQQGDESHDHKDGGGG